MKRCLILLLCWAALSTAGAEEGPLPPLPQHAGELMAWLDEALPESTKEAFDQLSDGSEVIAFHFSLGMWLRNQLNLWGDEQAISRDLRARHIDCADYTSTLIMEWYWLHRKGHVPVFPMPLGCLPRPGETGATWDAAEGIPAWTLANGTQLYAPMGAYLRVASASAEPEPVVLTDLCAAYAHPAWPPGQFLLLTGATTTARWQLRLPDGSWHSLPHGQHTVSLVSLEPEAAHFGQWNEDPDHFGYRKLRWSMLKPQDLILSEWDDRRAWDTNTWPQRRRSKPPAQP